MDESDDDATDARLAGPLHQRLEGKKRSGRAEWVTHAQARKCLEVAIRAQDVGHPVIDADGCDTRIMDPCANDPAPREHSGQSREVPWRLADEPH